MGQVIAFPVRPSPYPDLTADLDTAERVLLLAIRWWAESHREGDDPAPRLLQRLETAGVPGASFAIDSLMTVVSRAGIRPADINGPSCPHLSFDEKNLLQAASLAQGNASHLAAKVLRTTLLSAQGAELAVRPLGDLGELFGQVRLLLSRRRAAAGDAVTGDGLESCPPRLPC